MGGELLFLSPRQQLGQNCAYSWSTLPYLVMKDLLVPLADLLTTVAKLLGPGGAQVVVADSLLPQADQTILFRTA